MFLGCGRGRLRILGWQRCIFGCGLALGISASGCNPGDLSEERQDRFRAELEANYPGRGGEQTDAGETPAEMPSEETPAAPSTPECVTALLTTTCASAGCHNSGGLFPPSLDRAGLGGLLLAEESSCAELGRPKYLDVAAPENSYLLKKIRGEQPASCGARMPIGKTLSDDEVRCITEWVTQVAQGN